MKMLSLTGLLVAVLTAAPAFAKEADAPAVNADTKDAFTAVSAWVAKQMESGGRYAYVTPSERSTIEKRFTEMGALFDKSGSVAQMNDADKTRMFNDQEEINSILSKRDGERVICKNIVPIGSHIPVKTCKTVAQIEEERRNAGRFMQDKSVISQRQSSGN